ncbi:MAG TPA: hypothetical protein VG318_11055 [Actinomycetota bacterium]|nr:hypothetical protein [Actinomycetota bacterium]
MARKRGFFAELQHQSQLAAKRNEQAARAAQRANLAARREAERAHKAAERAAAQRARATAAEQKAAEREAKRLHDEAMTAEATARNAELAKIRDEIDSILSATLGRDDYVDLQSLRAVAEHPPFPRKDLEAPLPPPRRVAARPEPSFLEPQPPTGIAARLGGRRKHEQLVANQRAEFDADHRSWQSELATSAALHEKALEEHEQHEQRRVVALTEARRQYETECAEREFAAAETNKKLDELIAGIQYNVEDAIQQYVSIVLENSIFPESFPVEREFDFDAALKELSLTVVVPNPQKLPAEKEFKYVKAKDQVLPTLLPKKDQKERYNSAVFNVALRSLHEIFEADRAGRIQTITMKVCTQAVDPATGTEKNAVLVVAAAEREQFVTFDLANVVPRATLEHLAALVSKNPFDLLDVDGSHGVRAR